MINLTEAFSGECQPGYAATRSIHRDVQKERAREGSRINQSNRKSVSLCQGSEFSKTQRNNSIFQINVVVMRGKNDDEIMDFVRMTQARVGIGNSMTS